MDNQSVLTCLAATVLIVTTPSPLRAQSIFSIGNLPSANECWATAVSRDGCVVAAAFGGGTQDSAIWTRGGGLFDLGGIPGTQLVYPEYHTLSVNENGTVAVGYARSVFLEVRAFIWRHGQGMADLNINLTSSDVVIANAVSGSGDVVVGVDYDRGAFRWTSQSLDFLWPGEATAISRDGTVVVGTYSWGGQTRAVRWTEEEGPQDIGQFSPRAVSDDGNTIVGDRDSAPWGAVRWTSTTGTTTLSGGDGAIATAVSADGTTAAGYVVQGQGFSCLWTANDTLLRLDEILAQQGLNLTGWTLNGGASAISSDGKVVVGNGRYANQVDSAWVIWLGPHCTSNDFNHDNNVATDLDIEDFFRCLGGDCCATCDGPDTNGDGNVSTDADIEAFFRVLAGGPC